MNMPPYAKSTFTQAVQNILFDHGAIDTERLTNLMKMVHPELCDDSVKCECNGIHKGMPEWQHLLREVMAELKLRGSIKVVQGKWHLAR